MSVAEDNNNNNERVIDEVREYYGRVLSRSEDLQTNACTAAGAPPTHVRQALKNVHPEVLARFYGCGFVAPALLRGLRVLDLGCGAGRDVYVLAQLVGEGGEVVGVDMTEEQLAVARSTEEWHYKRFGYAKSNVRFVQGFIERLGELDLEEHSFDLIVSNCVINLSPDKPAVFREAFRLLKPGGELYFSDVYSAQRVPQSLREDPVLWGECISGALYWNDFLRIARECGFTDARLVEDSRITVQNAKIERKLGHLDFFSATYRLWKLHDLETDCEDYGQAVRYRGTVPDPAVPGATLRWIDLDAHHRFPTGKIVTVCGNTFSMLKDTRFAEHFDFFGDRSTHFGIFAGCGKNVPFASSGSAASAGASCDSGACGGGSCC